jgi:hypothetical protein
MSHITKIETKVHDPVAVGAACRRLGLTEPVKGTAQFFSGEASGLLLQLPGWQCPVVIDTASGAVEFDNYEGAWGEQHHLSRFLQMYAVEKCRLEARQKGCTFSEQQLQDGSMRLQIVEAH